MERLLNHSGTRVEELTLQSYRRIPPAEGTFITVNFTAREVGAYGDVVIGSGSRTVTEHEIESPPVSDEQHIPLSPNPSPVAPLRQPTEAEIRRFEWQEEQEAIREQHHRQRAGKLTCKITYSGDGEDSKVALAPMSDKELQEIRKNGGHAALPVNRLKLVANLAPGERVTARVVKKDEVKWTPDERHPGSFMPVHIAAGSIRITRRGTIPHEEAMATGARKITTERVSEELTFSPAQIEKLLAVAVPTAADMEAIAVRPRGPQRAVERIARGALPILFIGALAIGMVRDTLPTRNATMSPRDRTPHGRINPNPQPGERPANPKRNPEQARPRFTVTETHLVRNKEELWDDVASQLKRVSPNFARLEVENPAAFNNTVTAWVLIDESHNSVSNYRDLQPGTDKLTEYTDTAIRAFYAYISALPGAFSPQQELTQWIAVRNAFSTLQQANVNGDQIDFNNEARDIPSIKEASNTINTLLYRLAHSTERTATHHELRNAA